MDLISIIVPCYNVEPYVKRCIDSIINQTYSNLEIICIDDGSYDSTGEILDLFSKIDKRIRVIHQKNKGLAETRNIGKFLSKGEYIYFVDSDDWIELKTIEDMYSIAVLNKTDIVCSGFYLEYSNGKMIRNNRKNFSSIYTKDEALGLYLYTKYINPISCAKLYRRNVLYNVNYPDGKLYEDMNTTYKIIMNSKTVYYTTTPYYHYFQRRGSIGKLLDKEKNIELISAINEYWNAIKDNSEIVETAYCGYIFWLLIAYNHIICSGNSCEILLKYIRKCSYLSIIKCRYTTIRKKFQLVLIKLIPLLYKKIYLFFWNLKINRL